MNRLATALVPLLGGLASITAAAQTEQEEPAARPAGQGPEETRIPEDGVRIPADLSRGWPVVEAKINGRGPYRFILDTGAGSTLLDSELAAELGLESLGKQRMGDPSDPSANEVDVHRLERLELGGAVFVGLGAVSWDRGNVMRRPGLELSGVIGLPTFVDCLLTLDYPAGDVALKRGELPKADGLTVIDYGFDRFGVPTFTIEAAGHRVDAHLDSGNASSLLLPRSLRDEISLVEGSVRTGRGMRASGPVEFTIGTLDGVVKVGSLAFERPEVRFDDKLDHGNVGYGLLKGVAVTVDQRNRRLRFAEPEAGSAGREEDGEGGRE